MGVLTTDSQPMIIHLSGYHPETKFFLVVFSTFIGIFLVICKLDSLIIVTVNVFGLNFSQTAKVKWRHDLHLNSYLNGCSSQESNSAPDYRLRGKTTTLNY